jgi:hypothetical protein
VLTCEPVVLKEAKENFNLEERPSKLAASLPATLPPVNTRISVFVNEKQIQINFQNGN